MHIWLPNLEQIFVLFIVVVSDDGVGDGDYGDNCLPVMPEKARGTVGQPEAE